MIFSYSMYYKHLEMIYTIQEHVNRLCTNTTSIFSLLLSNTEKNSLNGENAYFGLQFKGTAVCGCMLSGACSGGSLVLAVGSRQKMGNGGGLSNLQVCAPLAHLLQQSSTS